MTQTNPRVRTGDKGRPEEPGRIIAQYDGNGHHGVITVEYGGDEFRDTPCAGCPWVVDNVGLFPPEVFRHSARTAYDLSRHTFASHSSERERPVICAGFLMRGATHNMTIRVNGLARLGEEECRSERELFRSYRIMAIANGVSPDDPALEKCRDSGYEQPGDPCERNPWGNLRPSTQESA